MHTNPSEFDKNWTSFAAQYNTSSQSFSATQNPYAVAHRPHSTAPVQPINQGGIQGASPAGLSAFSNWVPDVAAQPASSAGMSQAGQNVTPSPYRTTLPIAHMPPVASHPAPGYLANGPVLAYSDSTGRNIAFSDQRQLPQQPLPATPLSRQVDSRPRYLRTDAAIINLVDQYLNTRRTSRGPESGFMSMRLDANNALNVPAPHDDRLILISLVKGFEDFIHQLGMQNRSNGDAFAIAGNANARLLLINYAHLITGGHVPKPNPSRSAVDNFIMDMAARGTSAPPQPPVIDKMGRLNNQVIKTYRLDLTESLHAAYQASGNACGRNPTRTVDNEISLVRKFATSFLHIGHLIDPSIKTSIEDWKTDGATKNALTHYQNVFCRSVHRSSDAIPRFISFLDTGIVSVAAETPSGPMRAS